MPGIAEIHSAAWDGKGLRPCLEYGLQDQDKGQREDIRAIGEQIEAANLEVARGRKLLLKEEIDAQDFREIKRENEKKIEMLEARLIEVSRLSTNIEPLLEKAVSNLAHLDEL